MKSLNLICLGSVEKTRWESLRKGSGDWPVSRYARAILVQSRKSSCRQFYRRIGGWENIGFSDSTLCRSPSLLLVGAAAHSQSEWRRPPSTALSPIYYPLSLYSSLSPLWPSDPSLRHVIFSPFRAMMMLFCCFAKQVLYEIEKRISGTFHKTFHETISSKTLQYVTYPGPGYGGGGGGREYTRHQQIFRCKQFWKEEQYRRIIMKRDFLIT
jgi:hypothetical protein